MDRVLVGLDFFDASINRISAWVIGIRNAQKAMLYSLLLPHDSLNKLQEEKNYTKLMAILEEIKTLPFYDIWNYYLKQNNLNIDMDWYKDVIDYEEKELAKRG